MVPFDLRRDAMDSVWQAITQRRLTCTQTRDACRVKQALFFTPLSWITECRRRETPGFFSARITAGLTAQSEPLSLCVPDLHRNALQEPRSRKHTARMRS